MPIMAAHESGSNIALTDRFDELEGKLKTFKDNFEALLVSIASLKDEALARPIRQDGAMARQMSESAANLSKQISLQAENLPTDVVAGEFKVRESDSPILRQGREASKKFSKTSSDLSAAAPLHALSADADRGEFVDRGSDTGRQSDQGESIVASNGAEDSVDDLALSSRSVMRKHTFLKIEKTDKKSRMNLSRASIDKGNWPATLSIDWPQSLASRYAEGEISDEDEEGHVRNAIISMIYKSKRLGHLSEAASSDNISATTSRASMLVLTPTHPFRLLFDICSMVCLAYDLITIPMFLAWGVEETGIIQYVQIAVMFFWTVDIIASFRTGYVYDGEVVTDSLQIAKRYLKGPFIIEVSIVAIDWSGFIASGSGTSITAESTSKVMRFGKLSRVLRLMGVIRVAKVTEALHRILDRNVSRGAVLAVELLKLITTIVYINHVLGCMWFALAQGPISSDTGARWTDQLIVGEGGRYEDTTFLFQYSSAFHWALTQMTPGSMQVNAQNSAERIVNVSCLLFGMLFFSSLISTLSAKLMAVRMRNATRNSQMSVMMTFLRERKIGSSLAFVIKRQVHERMQLKEPLRQQNVTAFKLLSERLQSELHMTICKPLISTYSVFVVMFRLARHHASQVCFHAMEFEALNGHDVLFSAGAACNDSYVVSQGSLEYTQTPETALVCEAKTHRVDAGSWLCDASLWAEWIHVGTTQCVDFVEVLIVKVTQLIDATKKNLVLKTFMSRFGKAYYQHLISLGYSNIPNDLCGDVLDNVYILSTMDKDFSQLISYASLEILHETSIWIKPQPLIEEVRLGRTTLIPRSDTQVQRCVHVSCLKLFCMDGEVLVLLGKWDQLENKLEVSVKLPGTKMMGWENPELALERFVKEDLAILEAFITLESMEKEHEVQNSHYGILTDYTRNIFVASVKDIPEIRDAMTPTTPSGGWGGRPNQDKRDFSCITFKNQRHMHVYAWLSVERFESLTGMSNRSYAEQLLRDFNIKEAVEVDLEDAEHEERAPGDFFV